MTPSSKLMFLHQQHQQHQQQSPTTLGHRNDSLVEGLLGSIYDRFNVSLKDSFDSDVFTELSSSRFSGATDEEYSTGADHESEARRNYNLARSQMQHLGKLLFNCFTHFFKLKKV